MKIPPMTLLLAVSGIVFTCLAQMAKTDTAKPSTAESGQSQLSLRERAAIRKALLSVIRKRAMMLVLVLSERDPTSMSISTE